MGIQIFGFITKEDWSQAMGPSLGMGSKMQAMQKLQVMFFLIYEMKVVIS